MAPVSAALLVIALVATGAAVYRMAGVLACLWGNPRALVQRGRSVFSRLRELALGNTYLSHAFASARKRRHLRELKLGMPEALRLLSIALDAGTSLVKALEYAADNCSEPLAGELKRTVWDLKAGQGLDEALQGLRARTGGSEFAYLSAAMEIQHRSGGSLGEVLASVSDSLRQSAELEEELRTKTTQGRLSARIVAWMPLALAALITVLSPGYFGAFFSSPLGVALLVTALLLEVAGVLLVKRALAVDLSAAPGGGRSR